MILIKIGRRGQITLPSLLRRQFGLQEGDNLALIPQEDQVILKPLHRTLLDLRGSVPVSGPQDLRAVRQQVIQEHVRQLAEDKGEYEP
jgi:AbrB family looped-hinge helix DNA binding protein